MYVLLPLKGLRFRSPAISSLSTSNLSTSGNEIDDAEPMISFTSILTWHSREWEYKIVTTIELFKGKEFERGIGAEPSSVRQCAKNYIF